MYETPPAAMSKAEVNTLLLGRALISLMFDAFINNHLFGRAFISPSLTHFSPNGTEYTYTSVASPG
jgi:hypothetical protein